MIWFWVVAGLLVAAALLVLLRPLVRPGSGGDSEPAAEMFRRQLSAIDGELAQGRLDVAAAEAARTEVTRRMLAAAERAAGGAGPGGAAETSWRIGAAIGIAGVLPAAALAIYVAVGSPAAVVGGRPAAAASAGDAGPHTAAELATAADRLKEKLKAEPNDLNSWVMLGRTLVALDRYAEAHDAYDHALKLTPDEPELHAELGEVIVLEAKGDVTAAAEAEFAKSGDDPRARFYGAQAKVQKGDIAGAKAELEALLKSAPADAPWRKIVAARLAQIAPGTEIPAAAAPSVAAGVPGPSAADIAAAQNMSPDDRQAMIRGMVARLAQKLEANPGDKEGWLRLAHAYDVLGEHDKAEAARARAGNAAPTSAPATAEPVAPRSGPSAADMAAAQQMSPEDRQAMVRGMVARLAAKMEQNPGDKEGWLRLAHAYDVLGEHDKAEAARARAGGAAPASPPATAEPAAPTGPSAADIAAARKMSPEQQQAMIEGMVGRLAAKMAADPNDAEGWLRLAHAYDVLGRGSDALAALKSGSGHVPESLALLTAYMGALASGMTDERPPPDLVNVATRVNALDGKEPNALWYLGLAAAARGDKFRAAGYWSALAAELPADSSQKKLVQQRLDALR